MLSDYETEKSVVLGSRLSRFMPASKAALICCLCSSLLTICFGQTGAPKSSESEWNLLPEAPITATMKARIRESLIEDNKDEELQDATSAALQSMVKLVRLDNQGRIGIMVKVAARLCGATGNCGVYIFDGKTADVLVTDDGWDYGFLRSMHHGVYDFYVRSNLSVDSGTRDEFQFDGRVYHLVKSITGHQY
jgi:hypothetical protein